MATLTLSASGASLSAGAAALALILSLSASGDSLSSSTSAYLIIIKDAQVTQVTLQADTSAEEADVTQAGLGVDVSQTEQRRVTQVMLQVDGKTQIERDATQVTMGVDAGETEQRRITQAALQVDARFVRPETTVNCWEFHAANRMGAHLAYLDGAYDKAYLSQLNDVGSGTFRIHANDPKATDANLTIGNIVLVRYRNVDVGAFLIDEVDEGLVSEGEEEAKVFTVSGRGLLALLEDGLVYPSDIGDPTTVERAFTAQAWADIFLTLYNEFTARGGGDLTPDFNALVDSRGLAWTDSNTLNFKAGQTLLDVSKHLSALGLDVTTSPDRTLHAWIEAGDDLRDSVFFRHGQNLLACRRGRIGKELSNVVLGEGQAALVERTDAASIVSYGRREAYLSAQNSASAGQVTAASDLLLSQRKDPVDALAVAVTTEEYFPLLSYAVGDIVWIDVPGEVSDAYRILSIAIRERNDPCDLEVVLEINSLALEYLVKLAKAMEASRQSVQATGGAATGLAAGDTRRGSVEGHTHLEADVTDLEHDAVKLQTRDVDSAAPNDGDGLVWNAATSKWEPAAGGGAAPVGASYVVEDADATLTNEKVLGTTVITTATYAARQAAAKAGRIFLPSDGVQIERDAGAAWAPWGPIYPLVAPVNGDFAWVNQGGASVDTTYGGIYLLAPAGAGDNMRVRDKAVPSSPYTLTVCILPHLHGQSYNMCGLCLRDSGTGKLVTLQVVWTTAWRMEVNKMNSPSSFSANYLTITNPTWGPIWLRFQDDGANRKSLWSMDGRHWHQIHTVGRTDWITPDRAGFFAASVNATYPAGMTLLSWEEA